MKILTSRFILFFLCSISISQPIAADNGQASEYIVFKTIEDEDASSDCSQRGGLRIYVENIHPEKVIDISLDRYFSDVRQAGRSMFALANGHRQALGCNIVMDSPQRWKLVSAKFIKRMDAVKRYGKLY